MFKTLKTHQNIFQEEALKCGFLKNMSTTNFTVEMVLYDHQQHREIYFVSFMSINTTTTKMKSMGKYLIFFVTELIFLIENNRTSYFGMAKQFIKLHLPFNTAFIFS